MCRNGQSIKMRIKAETMFVKRNNYLLSRYSSVSTTSNTFKPFQFATPKTKNVSLGKCNVYNRLGEIQEDVLFHNQMKPLIYMLRAVGAFPVMNGPSGMPTFYFFSPIMAYSVCFYIISFIMSLIAIQERWLDYMREDYVFSDMIQTSVFISLLVTCIWAPLLIWFDIGNTMVYFAKWKEFQTLFERVTGESLELGIKSAVRVSVVLTILGALSGIAVHFTLPHADIWHQPAYLLSSMLTAAIISVKYVMFKALMTAGRKYNKYFKNDLGRMLNSSKMLTEYRFLWLRWSKLVSEDYFMMGKMYGFSLLVMLFNLVITLYSLVNANMTESVDLMKNLNISSTCIPCALTLYGICNGGYQLHNIGQQVREELQLITPSQISEELRHEVNIFLSITFMNPPTVSIAGFATIDRALFTSFMSTIVTYMIVLVQFDTTKETSGNKTSIK